VVKEDSDFDLIPEGAEFTDPRATSGPSRSYENVSFTSQTLYDMAVNDKERQKRWKRSYPGKVRQLPSGEFVVDDDARPVSLAVRRREGYRYHARRPGAGGSAADGRSGRGGDRWRACWSVLPGPGTFAGAVACGGSVPRSVRVFNDLVLQLAGVYDRSTGEEAGELALAGAFGAGGSALGRGIARWVAART